MHTKIFLYFIFLSLFILPVKAENGHDLWLRSKTKRPVKVECTIKSPTMNIAREEIENGWMGAENALVKLQIVQDKAIRDDGFSISGNTIKAHTETGLLYGVYELLRCQQTGKNNYDQLSNPSYERRILNHWDNLDGSIERGYAGLSFFWPKKSDSLVVTEQDILLWKQYARANASVGINGAVLNNVNASASILKREYLERVKAIAGILRPYGIKTYLSINFSSPVLLGGLKTSDPVNEEVIRWWEAKVKEIYSLIPDFGGFLVKANSEGQPGPQDFGRTHADGANMLARALQPFQGIVMWRAFVYNPTEQDRAKQAYAEFVPLDGKFDDNVIIQVKNGPVDFQPREPFSPLFGAMKKTPVMAELQITQEYLGQSIHLVYLGTMWEEFLRSDTYQEGEGSTVARCTDGSIFPQKITAIAGVANTGLDTNWCGHLFAQSNWYVFGRLAWNNRLPAEQIAEEWIRITLYNDSQIGNTEPRFSEEWINNVLVPVKKIMLRSREAAVDYMMPLGLHHIFAANHHYGPGPWWAPQGVRKDWTPPYYHQADTNGIGFNRTKSGSDAVSQYHEPLASMFNNVKTCPEIYLLWFHHLPWNYQLKSGQSLWDEMCMHYEAGVKEVKEFQGMWENTKAYIDAEKFNHVKQKLDLQYENACLWKDSCLSYFQKFSRMPIPDAMKAGISKGGNPRP